MKAFIFDLDGVLVDTCQMHFDTLNQALMQHGFSPIHRSIHNLALNGLPTTEKLRRLGYKKADIRLINDSKQLLTSKAIESIRIDEERLEVLAYLQSLGKTLGLVTNASARTVQKIIDNSGIANIFGAVITNSDVKCPKPDPEGYLLAMRQLNSLQRETSIIEDSDNGYKAAVRSGACCVKRVSGPHEVTVKMIKELL